MSQTYWYVCEVYECPVCGSTDEYRYRVKEKPESYWIFHVDYDWCDAL